MLDQIEYYDNPFWDTRSIHNRVKPENVNFPAVMISGWYDIMQNDTIYLWDQFKSALNTPATPRVLFVGPYGHCIFDDGRLAHAWDMYGP